MLGEDPLPLNPQIPFHSHLFVNLSFSLYNNNNTRKKKVWFQTYWKVSYSNSRLSIPYRTGRYGRNIPYRPAIRYTRPLVSYRKKYRPDQPISGNTGRYRAYRPVQKKVFFFIFLFFILSFVIFEFLLGQNGNLFALTY